jgi:alcohol dehydrogenase
MEINFYCPSNICFAPGALGALPRAVRLYGGRKVLFVTDPGIVQIGLAARALRLLEDDGFQYIVFDGVTSDPSDELCQSIYDFAKDQRCDVLVALGGGSTLDAAKAVNILFANPGPISLYEGTNKIARHGLPLIAVPTTAGTGSEADSNAVITNVAAKRKMILVGINNGPDYAICDPELTLTLPPDITAGPGMDALTHAMEAYLSKRATPMTDIHALKGMNLIYNNLAECVNNGSNLEARSNQMLGTIFAAIAMSNAGQGVCHATTAPLGAFFHVPHGVANAICLPVAMKFNAEAVPEKMVEMGAAMGMGDPSALTADDVVGNIFRLSRDCHLPGLKSFGVSLDKITEEFVTEVVEEYSASCNPRPIRREDVRPFIEACL